MKFLADFAIVENKDKLCCKNMKAFGVLDVLVVRAFTEQSRSFHFCTKLKFPVLSSNVL